jgi:hypothetical protein
MDIASSLLVPDWSRGSIHGNQGVVIAETGFKNDQPPLAKPDRRSQFGRSSFAEHPHLTEETTVHDGHFGRNGESSLADPVWRTHPLTELINFGSVRS